MKRKHKLYIKLNLMSLFFIVVSLISGTLAWFAYSGLSDVATNIDIRAWKIDLTKNGETVTNQEIGRASCRERGLRLVTIAVVSVS